MTTIFPSMPQMGDPQVVRALEEYTSALEAGQTPNRNAILARYPEAAEVLAECFDALDFVRSAAPQLQTQDAAESDLGPATPLGDFRILRQVGRGGMGVVYEAEQLSLGRRVALKVLPFAATMDPRQLQRFQNEARAAASLEHPHIVPVYGVGCERGVHYYAMKFIEGQALDALVESLRVQHSADGQTRRQGDGKTRRQELAVRSPGLLVSHSPILLVSRSPGRRVCRAGAANTITA